MLKLFSFLIIVPLFASSQNTISKKHIQLTAGTSFNGTGDIRGFAFNTEYDQYFKKKFSWNIGMGGTIHDKVEPIFYTDQSGNLIDASVRATTAGFQVTCLLSYSIIKTEEHEFFTRIGPLFRYQSTSYWDVLAVYHPAGTGLPFPVVAFINTSPQRTVAIGGAVQIGYAYSINKKISLGILGSFQLDSNGDVLRNALISIGRRF
jgi:hypothetical protein